MVPRHSENDTQHNDIQHKNTQHNDIQHYENQLNDIQHSETQHNSFKTRQSALTLSIMIFYIMKLNIAI